MSPSNLDTRRSPDGKVLDIDWPSSEPVDTATIDEKADAILDGFARGDLDETQTRQRLAELAFRSGIHRSTAGASRLRGAQARSDIADSLAELTIQKILSTADNGYSLEKGRGRSLCGYARNLQFSALRSAMRSHRRANRHIPETDLQTISSSPDGEEWGLDDLLAPAPSAEAVVFDERTAAEDRVRGWHSDEERIHFVAHRIVEATGVPYPIRPYSADDRDFVRFELARDPSLAWRSLSAYRKLIDGERFEPIDDRVLALWDVLSYEDAIALLAEADERKLCVLALSAVIDLVRPARPVIRSIVAQLTGSRAQAASTEAMAGLVEAFLAREGTPINPHDHLCDSEARMEIIRQREAEAAMFPQRLREVIALPGHPLGTDAAEIFDRLVALWRSVYGSRVW